MAGDSTLFEAGTLVAFVLIFDTWERLSPGRKVDRRKHLKLDLLALLVVIVAGTFWKSLLLAGYEAADLSRFFTPLAPIHELPSVLKVTIGLVVTDFALFLVHWSMHASDLLWRTHVFHHTIEELYWLSGARTSVTHLFLFALPQVLLAYGVFGLTAGEAAVAFSIGVIINLWVHTNIRVNLGPLSKLIITPDYHRIHHAADSRCNTNYGFILTVWDRLFRRFTDPRRTPDDFPLGLVDPETDTPRLIIGV